MSQSQQSSSATNQPSTTGALPDRGRLLAIDLGMARIGIAICDPLRLGARPLQTLTRRSRNEDFATLADLTLHQEITAVICGLPLNMDGSSGQQAATTRKWAMRLAHALRTLVGHAIPIVLWDERLSTYAANAQSDQWSPEVGEDAAAAAVILQSFLDAQRRGESVSETDLIVLPPRPDVPEAGR